MSRWIAVSVVMVVVFAGCDDGGEKRMAVNGRVTVGGQPLSGGSGSIAFLPTNGGQSAGVTIKDGTFSIEQKNGPTPGKYAVDITYFAPTGEKFQDPASPGRMVSVTGQVVPEKYRGPNSELTVELSLDTTKDLVFELDEK